MEQFLLNLGKLSLLVGAVIALLLALRPLLGKWYRAKMFYALWLCLAVMLLLPFDYSVKSAPVHIEKPADYTVFVGSDKTTVVQTERFFAESATSPIETRDALAASEPTRYIPVTTILFCIYLAGGAVFVGVQLVRCFRFRRVIRRWKKDCTEERFTKLLSEEARSLKVKSPQLAVCEAVPTPMLLGLFHPTLILPHERYAETELRFILRHELTHLKRRDMAYKLVLLAANALHWFNPLVYLMLRTADEDIELSCDSAATLGMERAEKTAYSETLISAVQDKMHAVPATTCFGGTVERLKLRISNVLGADKRRGLGIAVFIVIAVVALGAAVSWGEKEERASSVEVFATMEDYAILQVKAIRENGIIYNISDKDGNIEQFSDTVEDVRVMDLSTMGKLEDFAPDGILELWTFAAEAKPTNRAGNTIELVGGQSLSDDGYYFDGFTTFIVMLHKDDGYHPLKSFFSNDGFGYASVPGYLHDIYCDLFDLNEPRYLIEDYLTYTDGYGREMTDDGEIIMGDGWYYYAPSRGAWANDPNEKTLWFSGYDTGSTFVVKTFDTTIDEAASYLLGNGWAKEKHNDQTVYVRYVESTTQHASIYLYERPEGGHYEVQTFWYDLSDKLNEWGWSNTAQVKSERQQLEAMVQSFTVVPASESSAQENTSVTEGGTLQRGEFNNIFGLSGYFEIETQEYSFSICRYYTDGGALLAESYGYEIDDYGVDFDNDGVYELVCNCVSGGDGHADALIYRLKDGVMELGYLDIEKLNLQDYFNWGVNSTGCQYDSQNKQFILSYTSKEDETRTNHKTCSYSDFTFSQWLESTYQASTSATLPVNTSDAAYDGVPKNVSSSRNYGGYQWFVADGYFSRYADGKGVEQLYKLPLSDDGKTPVVAAVSVIAARIALSYHVGGATMGQDVLRLFDVTTGTQTHEVVGYGSVAFYGDTIVKTTGFMPPAPDNLRISRDGGKTWEKLGDPKYLYGVSVTVSGSTVSYRDDNGSLSLAGDWLYISGIDTSTWDRSSGAAPEELSLRVNLETGETVVRNE